MNHQILSLGWDFFTEVEEVYARVFRELGILAPFTLDTNLCGRVASDGESIERSFVTSFFPSFDETVAFMAEFGVAHGCVFHVSLVVDSQTAGAIPGWFDYLTERAVPPPPSLPVIGYDVGDDGFFSALINMGGPDPLYDERFRLNGHGLFVEVADAFAFAEATDARAPEHAPFLVFEISGARWI